MDLSTCAALAIVETMAGMSFWPSHFEWIAGGQEASFLWSFLTVFCVQYLSLKYYRVVLYHRYFSPLRHLPGPTNNHPFFGQTIKLLKADNPTSLPAGWAKRFPDSPFIRYLGLGNSEILVPNTITAYKELVQTRCYSLSKPDWFVRAVGQMDGEGIFLMEGLQHRNQRRLLNGSFSRRSISRLQPIFRAKARELCVTLDGVIDNDDGIFDCDHVLSKKTIEVMTTAVLGTDYRHVQPVKENRSQFYKHWTLLEAFESFFNPGELGQVLLLANGYIPIRWLPLEANREASSATAWVHDLLTGMIKAKYCEVREAVARGGFVSEAQRDVLTFIVEEDLFDGKASGITEAQFVGHLIQTLGGGYDTTAIMLSWTCYVLAEKSDIQDALRAEIIKSASEISSGEIDKLKYLDNFVKEVLRVYPPAPSIPRKADIDLVVEGVLIPAGTTLDIRTSVILTNPTIWGSNAEEVDPTRWDRLDGEQTSPFAYNVFSNGPRICVGRQFALALVKTMIVELVKNFRIIGLEEKYKISSPGLMYKPAGLKVRVQRLT